MKLTYQDLIDNEALLNAALAEARLERAKAVHRYLIAPLARLFARPKPARHTRMLRRSAYC